MRLPGRTVLGLAVGLMLGGCAGGPRGPVGPVVSPTGIVYEPGTPPVRSRFSQTSALYLTQGLVERALEVAREGLASDSVNPIHYFLAGTAYSRLGDYEQADRMFTEAQRIYPAYELDIEPERRAAWGEAYNAGVQAYDSGNVDGAKEAWRKAAVIYDLRPEAHRNLASLLAGEGEYEEAIDAYQRALAGLDKRPATEVLSEEELQARALDEARTEESLAQVLLFEERFAEAEPLLQRQLQRDSANVQVLGDLAAALQGQGRDAEAAEIYSDLLSETRIEATDLFNLGVALFRAGDFLRAGEAFGRVTELRPSSRDAWFNYVNALFAAEDWATVASAGDRLVEVDPLGENAGLIVARAHLETGNQQAALAGLDRTENVPVHVEGLQMRPVGTATRIQGRVVGNKAESGSPIRLRFLFYDDAGAVGEETLLVTAPPEGESATFEVSFETRATAYRYELELSAP